MKKLICLAALAGAVLLAGCGRGAPVPPKNAAVPTFVVGMGCSDASCTDVSHHHDCPADCADYSHHHNCPLDCSDASHHHGGQSGTGAHHSEPGHHGGHH